MYGIHMPKGGVAMATSAFERKIVISDAASKEKMTQFFGIGRTCEKAGQASLFRRGKRTE